MNNINSIFKNYLVLISGIFLYAVCIRLITVPQVLYSLLPLSFFLASIVTFMRAIMGGYTLYPITWYILAVGIYFGLGLFGTTIPVSDYTTVIFGPSAHFIIDIFLINTFSVFIICYLSSINIESFKDIIINNKYKPLKFISIFIIIGYVIVKIMSFSEVENLLLRSVLEKYSYLANAIFFVAGYIYLKLEKVYKTTIILSLVIIYIIGVFSASKFQAITPLLSFLVALVYTRLSLKNIITAVLIICSIFIFTNVIIKTVRAHADYNQKNSMINRFEIVISSIESIKGQDIMIQAPPGENGEKRVVLANLSNDYAVPSIIKSVLLRFEIGTIQKFVFDQYNNGYPGDSFTRILSASVPRIFWKKKPIVIDEGRIVNTLLYPGQTTSSAAVTYVGEAYWNKGIIGVIIVSIFIGTIFSFFNIYIKKFYAGNPLYSVVVFPVILYALSIEGWLGVTFFSNLIHIIILIVLSIALNLIINYKKKFGY